MCFLSDLLLSGVLNNTIAVVAQTNDHIDYIIFIREIAITFNYSFKKYTICNWIFCHYFFSFYVTYITCEYVVYESIHTCMIWSVIFLLNIDIYTIYAIHLEIVLQNNITL